MQKATRQILILAMASGTCALAAWLGCRLPAAQPAVSARPAAHPSVERGGSRGEGGDGRGPGANVGTHGESRVAVLFAAPPEPLASEQVPPRGAGRLARMEGRITRGVGDTLRGVAGWIEFVGGPNRGVRIDCTEDGSFALEDLHPGFAEIEVQGAGAPWRRDVVLHSLRTSRLDLDLDLPPTVRGKVVTLQGFPVAGARVLVDGVETRADAMGRYVAVARAAGEVSLAVERPGFASHQSRLRIRRGSREFNAGSIVLQLECRLVVTVNSLPADPAGAFLIVVPGSDQALRRGRLAGPGFRWPGEIAIPPSGVVVLNGLPPGSVSVRVFHPLAHGESEEVRLDPKLSKSLSLKLVATRSFTGRVTANHVPLEGARVTLVASNLSNAHAAALGTASHMRFSQAIEALPGARQEVLTNAEGEFECGWWERGESLHSQRFLRVEASDGAVLHFEVLRTCPTKGLELDLERSRTIASLR